MVLITNAPRPAEVVMALLDGLEVPRAAYDAIVTSGDVTRAVIAARAGQSAFHVGPARDVPIFDGLAPLVPLASADYVVCSGLFDDTTETPQDYVALIAAMRARGLTMVCANPCSTPDSISTLRRRQPLRRRGQRRGAALLGVPAPPGPRRRRSPRVARPAPTKLVAVGDPAALDALEAELKPRFAGRLFISKSLPYFLEFAHPDVSKGSGLAFVAERLGFTREETVACGDGENDRELLDWAATASRSRTRIPTCSRAPTSSCPPVDEEGVAALLEAYLDSLP